jgi:hypothetical protein
MEKTTMKLASDVEALVYKGGIAHTVTVEAGAECEFIRETATHYVMRSGDHGTYILYLPMADTDFDYISEGEKP